MDILKTSTVFVTMKAPHSLLLKLPRIKYLVATLLSLGIVNEING
jgi:hypothetical protein